MKINSSSDCCHFCMTYDHGARVDCAERKLDSLKEAKEGYLNTFAELCRIKFYWENMPTFQTNIELFDKYDEFFVEMLNSIARGMGDNSNIVRNTEIGTKLGEVSFTSQY